MDRPNSLNDLLALVPGLRKMRSMNADLLRHLLDRERGQCTWCGQPVGKGRSKWCSDQCVEAFRSRCDSGHQVTLVNARDRGICQACGRDVRASEQAAKAEWERVRDGRSHYGSESRKAYLEVLGRYGWARGQWFEVDHIVPVIEGGGLIGIVNLRTLCGKCHHEVTKTLAGRRSKRNATTA